MPDSQHTNPRPDIEIARDADIRPIQEIGERLGIPGGKLLPFGHHKAKIPLEYVKSLAARADGKLIKFLWIE